MRSASTTTDRAYLIYNSKTMIISTLATVLISADSAAMKQCLTAAQAARAAAISTGTPRSVADKAWAAAVAKCKAKAEQSNSVYFAFKPAPTTIEPIDKTKGPKIVRRTIAANAEGLTDTFVPKPNNPPKQTRGGGTRLIAEGIDLPTLPRCTRITCPKGTTNLFRFSPNPEAPEAGGRGNLPRLLAKESDRNPRYVPPGRRGAPKGTGGGGTRMVNVAHYFG